ncbi:hypothetical protein C6361_19960 [Plantactinospora sp. BC1]|uniref:hypothetical protein n=1 Tax=Plantactinospora sp. BC1 TaxID=2108470 RepID=UPI000D15633E|nr:hypothetical protein [Plantactinospora sp. BC1]AVT31378.1 hypothetical protein C6361_19960 [Plantactinospora sp. BC1]
MAQRRLLWVGLAVALVGLTLNLGWFCGPPHVWLDDPNLVPMPEALPGWWVIATGVVLLLVLVLWSLRPRSRR